MGWRQADSYIARQKPVEGTCEHSNETSDFIKDEEFLHQPRRALLQLLNISVCSAELCTFGHELANEERRGYLVLLPSARLPLLERAALNKNCMRSKNVIKIFHHSANTRNMCRY